MVKDYLLNQRPDGGINICFGKIIHGLESR